MEVILNGKTISTQAETVAALIDEQDIVPTGIAIAVGTTIIPRARWEETRLEEKCNITVIRATQGG